MSLWGANMQPCSHAMLVKARPLKHNRGMARAQKVVEISTKLPMPEKNPAAVALGRMGGLKGGNARAAKLSPEERKEIAQRAAKQRWANRKSIELVPAADQAIDTENEAKLR